MHFPIVREYKTDIVHNNLENQIRGEPFKVDPGIWSRIIVPIHSPFFVDSLKVTFPNGQPMDESQYRIYRLMPRLTELTAQKVACMIELLDPTITEGKLDYDVVGEFSLFDTTLLHMVIAASEDDRPVWWENIKNKPVVFPPEWHTHSLLYDIMAFGDFVEVLGMISDAVETHGKPYLQIKIDHAFELFNHYLGIYKKTLADFLARHKASYNSHGLTALQVGLEKVDNFPTATASGALEGRRDRHLTVSGLQAIIDHYGFNPKDFIENGKLPIAQFGNTNFIPPSIDGSFEGLGGKSECAAITMEADGSIVFLSNRMDGRIDGLYYSVLEDPYTNPRLVYTSYRYSHPLLLADNAECDRIVQGSGREVIMLGDIRKNLFYIGLTNGTLDPTKHILTPINLDALKAPWNGNPNFSWNTWFRSLSVAYLGNWIYIFHAHNLENGKQADGVTDYRYRYLYRVRTSDVNAQIPVTATLVRPTFKDGDGVQWNNAPFFRWCTPQGYRRVNNNDTWERYYFTFKQSSNLAFTGIYRSQPTAVCPIPNKPGKYLVRFMAAWWARYVVPGVIGTWDLPLEMVYEMDPETGVMTLLHQTPRREIDFLNIPSSGDPKNRRINQLVFNDSEQGMDVLDDGTIVASYGAYQSFPRSAFYVVPRSFKSRYDVMNRTWMTDLGDIENQQLIAEKITSPIASSIKPRSFLLGNGGDVYTAGTNTLPSVITNQLWYRQSPGKLAERPEVSNLFFNKVVSRPLSNSVFRVEGPPQVGGAYVTVPSNLLDQYNTDLGEFTFCMGTQKANLDLSVAEGEWPAGNLPQDIKVMSGHTQQINPDGSMTMVPTGTILYPSSITARFVNHVANPTACRNSPKMFIGLCDPTGFLTDKFGWLPVIMIINYGEPGTTSRHWTILVIDPVYTGPVNARVVSDYTVLDVVHNVHLQGATGLTPASWDAFLGGGANTSGGGAMRVGYYLKSATELEGFIDSGVIAAGPGDSLTSFGTFRYTNRSTKRWTECIPSITGQSGGANHKTVTPDNGVANQMAYNVSTGGAATIFEGSVNNPLLGSVYPATGWYLFFQSELRVVFNGQNYTLKSISVDLSAIVPNPANKTFYLYAVLKNGNASYEVTLEKRAETPFIVWVGRAVTNDRQILTIERFNVFTINGNRISETKRGNCIPASSGLVNAEGQLPWLRSSEMLP